MEKPLLLLLAIPRYTAQLCSILRIFNCFLVRNYHTIPRNEMAQTEAIIAGNSAQRIPIGFDTHNPDPQISILTLKLLIRGSISISLINQSFLQLLNAGTTTMRDIE